MRTPTRQELERQKRASTLQLLMRCARLVNERAISRVNRAAGTPVFRAAIAALLPHIDHEGTRLTELARRVGVSKQAVSRVVAEMEAQGVVELASDPSDARARLVRFTPAGRRAIEHGLGVLAGLEAELAAVVGRTRMDGLRRTLQLLEDALDQGPPAPP